MKKAVRFLTAGLAVLLITCCLNACSQKNDGMTEQIVAVNGAITELQTLNTKLDGQVKTLEDRAQTLENSLTAVNQALEELDGETDGVSVALSQIKTALESEIAEIKTQIDGLKIKDRELQALILSFRDSLSSERTATEAWANQTFLSLTACEALKAEINGSIDILQNKIEGVETNVSTLVAAITALQTQVQKNKEEIKGINSSIASLQIQINCLNGKHVISDSFMQYKWADDFTSCEASSRCIYCRGNLSETVRTTWKGDYYLAQFPKYGFKEATNDGLKTFSLQQNEKFTLENSGVITNVGGETVTVSWKLESYERYNDLCLEIPAGGKVTWQRNHYLPLMEYATVNGCVYSLETGLLVSGDLTLDDGKSTWLMGSWFTNYTGEALTIIDNKVTATLTGEQSLVYCDEVTFKNGTITCVVDDNDYSAYFVLPANESIDITTVLEGETYISERITAGNEDCKYMAYWNSIDIIQGSLTIDGVTYTVHPSERESIIEFFDDYIKLLRNVIINGVEFIGWGFCVSINDDGSFTVFEESVTITLGANETAVVNGQTYSGGENGATFEIVVE